VLHARISDHSEGLQARVDHAAHAAGHHHVPVRHGRGRLVGSRLGLQMQLRMGQVARAGEVASTDRALLEVALEDITAREGIPAEYARVWAISSVTKQVALQMLCMEVGFWRSEGRGICHQRLWRGSWLFW
jgi:hypothetical protein